jgi:ubiquinone/menaquinone biosynthesis C-methylase UbiE
VSHGEHGHGHEHGDGHRDRHGNPADLDRYLARMLAEDRAAWQKPDEVVAALGLRPGDTVGEVGCGPGYFTLRLARAVGAPGRVLAADVVPEMLAHLRGRLGAEGLSQVTPHLARPEDPGFAPGSCQRILVVDTFHHFPDGPAYLRRLARALAPGGLIANVDFHRRELPVGPPVENKVAREDFLAAAAEAGLEVAVERDFLPYQYFFLLRPR